MNNHQDPAAPSPQDPAVKNRAADYFILRITLLCVGASFLLGLLLVALLML